MDYSNKLCSKLFQLLNIIVRRRVVNNISLAADKLCAGSICTLFPITHPLSVAPTIGAEKQDFFARKAALD